MPDSAVAAVEPHRVEAVEPVHPRREIRLGRLDEEVDVIVEHDPCVDDPAKAPLNVDQQLEPEDAVLIVEEDRPLFDAAANTVVPGRARQV
jgi:hypothetical protein